MIYKQISMFTLNTELKLANKKLQELSECDHLTKETRNKMYITLSMFYKNTLFMQNVLEA